MKISVVVGDFLSDQHDLLDGDVIWLTDTPANVELQKILRERSGKDTTIVVSRPPDSEERVFLQLFKEVSNRFPRWTEIECIGLQPNILIASEIVAPSGSASGVYLAQSPATDRYEKLPGFRLTRNLPQASFDRIEAWRQNLPPKHILGMTDRARKRIVEIRDSVQSQEPDKDVIPSLSWGPRSAKGPNDSEWRDLGEGFSLGFFHDPNRFPAEAVEICNGIEIIFRLGFGWKRFQGKKVDYVEGSGGFVLVG